MENSRKQKICLTIAGLDPSGGAGILADVRTFAAFGCYPAAVVTSLTFQNTTGVFGADNVDKETLVGQLRPVLEDFPIDAAKTGMLPTLELIEAAADMLTEYGIERIIVDPVVRSTSGFDLIDNAALRALVKRLFPISALVTPNLPEAERITGISIEEIDDIIAAARLIGEMGARNVLIKGGHFLAEDPEMAGARDFLFLDGELIVLAGEYYETTATHGTGCTLAAAITAGLALGHGLEDSVRTAKAFVNKAIRTAPNLGHGHSPINISPI